MRRLPTRRSSEGARRVGSSGEAAAGAAGPAPAPGSESAFERFWRIEASSAPLVLLAAATAFLIANSALGRAWESIWSRSISASVGTHVVDLTLHEFVDQGLMALFFLVIGLEIKRQIVAGELSKGRRIPLAAMAAAGGAVAATLTFLAINRGWPETRGWPVAIATDVALAVGVVALFGHRLPTGVRVFAASLAIFDSLLAIAAVCVLGSYGIDLMWLAISGGVVGLLVLVGRVRVDSLVLYAVLGLVLWACVLKSGVQATIAGALVAVVIPVSGTTTTPSRPGPLSRLEATLHPWVAYGIVPAFVLLNAGVRVTGDGLSYYMASRPVGLGVALGLLLAKPLGIAVSAVLFTRFGRTGLAAGMRVGHLVGSAALSGLGFSSSILVANLAYPQGSRYLNGARAAILVASLAAGTIAAGILFAASRTSGRSNATCGTGEARVGRSDKS